jgi:hypothetical protein
MAVDVTQWTKRQVIINGVIYSMFLALMIFGMVSGLIWRVPHIPQAILFFALGVYATVWARLLRDRRKARSSNTA